LTIPNWEARAKIAITFILFPLSFLGWVAGGLAAVILGIRAVAEEAGTGSNRRSGIAAIVLGTLGMLLSLGTCIIPQVIAWMLFG
jgi:hypothetical protein